MRRSDKTCSTSIMIALRMLAGIGARFGKDSSEYEQAGGVRKSDRKFPPRKTKATPPTP